MKHITHTVILGVVLFTTITLDSCREESDTVLSYAYDCRNTSNFDDANSSFEGQFKVIWMAMNCNYPIWDYEEMSGLDWDKVYDDYLPKFRALDERVKVKSDSVTNQELEKLYTEVFSPLRDGHFFAKVKNLCNGTVIKIYPAEIRNKSSHADCQTKIEISTAYYQNTDNEELRMDDYTEAHLFFSFTRGFEYALFNDGIVFLHLPNLDLSRILNEELLSDSLLDNLLGNDALLIKAYNETRRAQKAIWEKWFNKIQSLHLCDSLKGIVIDLRNNLGGTGTDYQYVLGALQAPDAVSAELNAKVHQIGLLRVKSGIGRKDFLPATPYYHPVYNEEHAVIDKEPIVFLANGFTGSTAEHICLGAKQMKNACVIGTQTWGAFSPLTGNVDLNGDYYSYTYTGIVGNESNAPFYLYIPFGAFFTNDGDLLESIGVTPDIEVPFNRDLYDRTGRDNQLERALEYIRTGK